jgi:hypothetical protein
MPFEPEDIERRTVAQQRRRPAHGTEVVGGTRTASAMHRAPAAPIASGAHLVDAGTRVPRRADPDGDEVTVVRVPLAQRKF